MKQARVYTAMEAVVGVREKIEIEFITATPGIFACPEYRVALEKQMQKKGGQNLAC